MTPRAPAAIGLTACLLAGPVVMQPTAALAAAGQAAPQPTAAQGAAAGTAALPLGESVEVRVVNVPVTVVNASGAPIRHLDKADFRLFEDGVEQTISNFSFVRAEVPRRDSTDPTAAPADPPPTGAPEQRRRFVFLFDRTTYDMAELARALEGLEAHLATVRVEDADWSVLAIGDRLDILEPATSSRESLLAAFDRLREMPSLAGAYRLERSIMDDSGRDDVQAMKVLLRSEQEVADDKLSDLRPALRFESRSNMQRAVARLRRVTDAMEVTFRAFGHVGGRKILVLLGDGLDMAPEYSDLVRRFDGGSTIGEAGIAQDPVLYQAHNEMRHMLDEAVREANAAGFAIHPVRTSGVDLVAPHADVSRDNGALNASYDSFSTTMEIDDLDSGPRTLAVGTGGAFHASNRLLTSLAEVDSQSSTYYSLGFSPQRPADGEYHRLRVEVRRPGARVQARRGYLDLDRQSMLERHLSGPLELQRELVGLPLALDLMNEDGGRLLATAELPLSALSFAPSGDNLEASLRIYLAIYDGSGELVDLSRREPPLSYPAHRHSDAVDESLRYRLRFALAEAGSYTVVVTVVDRLGGVMGNARRSLTIGPPPLPAG